MSRRGSMRSGAMLAAVGVCAGWTRGLCTRGAAGEGQQSDVARALDGHAEPALMAGADARHAAGQNLAALLNELRKNVGALVVDHVHLFDTELADFLFAEVLTLAAGASARAPGTSGTTFAARTAVTTRATFTTRTTGTTFATRSAGAAAGSRVAARRGMTAPGSVTACWSMTAFLVRGSAGSGRLRLFLFLCHNFVPFSFAGALLRAAQEFVLKLGTR
jgi:hypothetical protein